MPGAPGRRANVPSKSPTGDEPGTSSSGVRCTTAELCDHVELQMKGAESQIACSTRPFHDPQGSTARPASPPPRPALWARTGTPPSCAPPTSAATARPDTTAMAWGCPTPRAPATRATTAGRRPTPPRPPTAPPGACARAEGTAPWGRRTRRPASPGSTTTSRGARRRRYGPALIAVRGLGWRGCAVF